MVKCIICWASLNPGDKPVKGELVTCSECGTELEITSISPLEVAEAPMEEEDWGE